MTVLTGSGNAKRYAWRRLARLAGRFQSLGAVLLFFLAWEIVVRAANINESFLCTPSSAIAHLIFRQPDANYHWPVNITVTLYEFLLGFSATGVVGILLGILIIWSKTVQKTLMPLFILFNSMPMIAVAPILLIWMGYGLMTNILIAFLVSFFPMVVNTVTGLSSVDEDLLDLVRYLNARKWQVFWKIRLPNALPYIFSGLKICTTLSVMGVIVGELIASDKGLGYVIVNAQYMMDTPPMFASLIMMSLLGWGMFLLVSLAERMLMPWVFKRERA